MTLALKMGEIHLMLYFSIVLGLKSGNKSNLKKSYFEIIKTNFSQVSV